MTDDSERAGLPPKRFLIDELWLRRFVGGKIIASFVKLVTASSRVSIVCLSWPCAPCSHCAMSLRRVLRLENASAFRCASASFCASTSGSIAAVFGRVNQTISAPATTPAHARRRHRCRC